MKKKKYVKLRGENTMMFLIVFFIFATIVVNFVGQATIQSNNSEVQRLKSKIDTQEKLNASMQMKINELACLDNALEVADTFGLEYNNKNIRVVQEVQE